MKKMSLTDIGGKFGVPLRLAALIALMAPAAVADGPRRDYAADAAFVRAYRDGAVAIARRKMADDAAGREKTGIKAAPRLSTGGSFSGIFLWDTAFCCIWAARLPKGTLPAFESLDNLYRLALPDGFICREYTASGKPTWDDRHPVSFAPPLLSWAEYELFTHGHTDLTRLRNVLPILVRHHDACKRRFRRADGLYFGDMLGSGMDELPRWPVGKKPEECGEGKIDFSRDTIGPESRDMWDMPWFQSFLPHFNWNRQAAWIDLSSQMALDAKMISAIAAKLGWGVTAENFKNEHAEISAAINRLCWDEATGFYYDRGPDGLIMRRHAGAFWTLIAGVATGERAARLARAALDEKGFGRPCGLPALPADDPDYRPETGYWCGVVWPPTTYMTVRGLAETGHREAAELIARRWYNANAALWERDRTCYENISPEQCDHAKTRSGRDFCGWSALAPVAIPVDFGFAPKAGTASEIQAGFPVTLKVGEERVIDFGPDGVGGYPSVEFCGTEGEATVRLAYATHPDGLGEKGDFWHETRANYMGDDVWLPILPANTDRYDVFKWRGAGTWRAPLAQGLVRYARLKVESGAAVIRAVEFVNDGIHSEEKPVGEFSCSDARVNGVWAASVRTCQLASVPARTNAIAVSSSRTNAVLGVTHAYLSDGAKRDRLVWSGDLWFAQRNLYAAFAPESPYMAGSLRMLAENRTPEGYVQACPYPESHGPLKAGEYGPFASDEFAAWFIPVLHDHVLYTGDLALAHELFGTVSDLVAYLRRHTATDGIFVQRAETSKHSCGLAVGGTSTHHRSYMNILLHLAYHDAAELAAWLGDETRRAAWTAHADATAVAVRREFWDREKGHFRLSREEDKFGFEANALALAARFATREEASRILPQLTFNWHGKFQLLALRGAFAYGDGEKAMALVGGHNWYRLLSPEWKGVRTIQECDNLCTKGWGDEAHPDACPGGDLVEGLLGVRPLEPGYRAFSVKPVPSAAIGSASGRIPTPHGFIEVSWRRGKDGLELTVRNPPGTRRVE